MIDAIPTGRRIAVGLFQAVAVRTAGFNIVSFDTVAPGLLVFTLVAMYSK